MNVLEKLRFGNIPYKLDRFVDDRFRYAPNGVPLREMREFIHFDDISNHVFVLNRHFVSQPGYWRAVRSSWRNEDLNVQTLV